MHSLRQPRKPRTGHLASIVRYLVREFLAILSATLLVATPVHAFTPAGTTISNQASVSYVDGASTSYNLSSNTDTFVVEYAAITDALMQPSIVDNRRIVAGDTIPLNLNIDNTGNQDLVSAQLLIRTGFDTNITVTGVNASLVEKTVDGVVVVKPSFAATTNTIDLATTHRYNLDTLLSAQSAALSISLPLPAAMNIANNTITFEYYSNGTLIDSQTLTLNINGRTKSTIEILQYSTSPTAKIVPIPTTEYDSGSGTFSTLPSPTIPNTNIPVAGQSLPLEPTKRITSDQPIFVMVGDADQNLYDNVQETIVLEIKTNQSGDTEKIRLYETGPNTGIFTGYLKAVVTTSTANNGAVDVASNTSVNFDYTDVADASDNSNEVLVVDPYGVLFDSHTGARLNGYTVYLIDANTGQPAVVYGDDGVSSYPSSVVTGSTVTDSSGKAYTFESGQYRFPFAAVGTYRLVVVPPNGASYRWPTLVSNAALAETPDGPYSIVLGSRGEDFALNAGPAMNIDIPVDPLTSTIYILRSADKLSVSPGDFIQFKVEVENTTAIPISAVTLQETLPRGFRLQGNSLRVDGVAATPTIAADGRSLELLLGDMAAKQKIVVEYVAAVGAMHSGMHNTASYASGNGGASTSNRINLGIQVIDELMMDSAIVVGQVNLMLDKDEKATLYKLDGIRVYMENGRYALTDENGQYHFEGVTPGTHVIQLDTDTLPEGYEVVDHEKNTRRAGTAYSEFVDLQGGTLWRTDFHIRSNKKIKLGKTTLRIYNDDPLLNGDIRYNLEVIADKGDAKNMRVTIMLPESLQYKEHSALLGDAQFDSVTFKHNFLTFRLGDVTPQGKQILRFIVSPQYPVADNIVMKAFGIFNSNKERGIKTPVATHVLNKEAIKYERLSKEIKLNLSFDEYTTLSQQDRQKMDETVKELASYERIRVHAYGHSDSWPMTKESSILLYGNNNRLSAIRAQVVADYLRDHLGLSDKDIVKLGLGPFFPIDTNRTESGRKANRRVELTIAAAYSGLPDGIDRSVSSNIAEVEFELADGPSAKPLQRKPEYDEAWLKDKDNRAEWVYPQPGFLPDIASMKTVIKHHNDHHVTLMLNGKEVPAANYDRTIHNKQNAALSSWLGIDLKPGDNHFVAIVADKNGKEVERFEFDTHLSTQPVRAEVIKEKSQLIADGLNQPVIAVRFFDRDGYPARTGTTGEYRIEAPYAPARSDSQNIENLPGSPMLRDKYLVEENGIAYLRLEPSSEADNVKLHIPLADGNKALLTPKLHAKQRDWILVGLGEGTVGYNTIKDNAVANDGSQSDLYQDGRVAFFAKGMIKGEWLLTIAYDSNKPDANNGGPNLYQTIDPTAYYGIYGDNSQGGMDAKSSEKLYLKLEKDQFFVLFGDYNTDLNQTQLSKYTRTLTGLKSRYENQLVDVVVFASQTDQGFMKYEMRGEGHSGPYQLPSNNIALNSEIITLEVRDRFHSDRVLETRALSRFADYDIDYSKGSITFREPVFSINSDLNHIYIVVKYESFNNTNEGLIAGGRVTTQVTPQTRVGVTAVSEEQLGANSSLSGVDVEHKLSDSTTLRVEAAHTVDQSIITENKEGNAHYLAVEHQSGTLNAKAYSRSQGDGFGLGQADGALNDTRKNGAEANYRLNEKINVNGEVSVENNDATGATRTLAQAKGQYRFGSGHADLGVREVKDEMGDNSTAESQQITAGVRKEYFDNAVAIKLEREQNINNDNSVDYPHRTRAGLDYNVTSSTTLFVEAEMTDGNNADTQTTLVGVKSRPWQGGEVYTGVKQSSDLQEDRTSANAAVKQQLQINKQWSLNLGLEQSKLLSQTSRAPFNTNVANTSGGNESYTAASAGLTYKPGSWIWSGRGEARVADSEYRALVQSSISTSFNNNISLLAGLRSQYQKQRYLQSSATDHDLSLGLAYRPLSSRWTVLDKLALRIEEQHGSFNSEEQRIINLLNLNYKANPWQLGLQYGAKTVSNTIGTTTYQNFVDLYGVETRYDLNEHWDVGVHSRILRATLQNQMDYNHGISVGHTFGKNIWLSAGYNMSGFTDKDYSRSNFTSAGPFIQFRLKFDQHSFKKTEPVTKETMPKSGNNELGI